MRTGSIALVLTGLLASTSAVGIVLWNSSKDEAGSHAVAGAVVDVNAVKGDDAVTVEAVFDPSLIALQYDEDFLNAILPFEQARSTLGLPASDFATPTMNPLSVDTGLAHVQQSAEIDMSGELLAYTAPHAASALATPGSLRWSGATAGGGGRGGVGGGGGGGAGGGANNGSNTETTVPDDVDNTGPADEQERPAGRDQSPDEPNHQGGGPNGDHWSELPTGPIDSLPTTPVDPVINPPVSVPEPGTVGLLLMGAAGLLFGRRKPRALNAH